MDTFSALLAICAGNSPVPGEFPTQRPVTRSFDVFFDLRPNKRLSKQSWGWRFETLSHPLRRHRNDLFENLVRPILLYGSDGWGVNASIDMTIDKLFYQYMRCVLNVKSTASNVIVVGECGQMPPSLYCHMNTLSYLKRLQDLPDTKIVKQVFNELNRLHLYGVKTWVTKACELAEKYGIDIVSSNQNFKKHCKLVILDWHKRNWSTEVVNVHKS